MRMIQNKYLGGGEDYGAFDHVQNTTEECDQNNSSLAVNAYGLQDPQ